MKAAFRREPERRFFHRMTIYMLPPEPLFPDPNQAEPDGLLAVGGDLSVDRLVSGYSLGIFPWYGPDSPILWWTPDPRLILAPNWLHVSRRLERTLRSGKFTFTLDTAFEQVLHSCACSPRPQGDGTWLVPEMIDAYSELHRAGYAHSVEAWVARDVFEAAQEQGVADVYCEVRDTDFDYDPPAPGLVLAGGLYGVGLGRVFYGESMFFRVPDASKAAFAWFARTLGEWGYEMIDCQQTTAHMLRFGAREVSRMEFHARLHRAMSHDTMLGSWTGLV